MSKVGKVRVEVKSRRVPVRTVEFVTHPILPIGTISTSVGSFSGPGLRRERVVVYESVLDEEQRRAIDEGHRLACNLGLELEVVDKSKSSLLGRLLSFVGGNSSKSPNVEVFPSDRSMTGPVTDSDLVLTDAV